MRNPEMLDFSPNDIGRGDHRAVLFHRRRRSKSSICSRLFEREKPAQAIVFCRTRRGTEKVGQRLGKKVPGVAAIHGDLMQTVRDRVMKEFREGNVQVLVATDVVGRGIDVTGISHIINYDIPQFCDDYVHRVGRTGRMGREGVAYTFVTPEEGNELTRIEMRINRLLIRQEAPGLGAGWLGPRPIRPRWKPGRTAPRGWATSPPKSAQAGQQARLRPPRRPPPSQGLVTKGKVTGCRSGAPPLEADDRLRCAW